MRGLKLVALNIVKYVNKILCVCMCLVVSLIFTLFYIHNYILQHNPHLVAVVAAAQQAQTQKI